MPIDEIELTLEEEADRAISHLKQELRGIRTGRASAGLIEYVRVEAYGSMTELKNLASISVPESTQILVKPFDASVNQDIIKALQATDLGLSVHSEGGKSIRIVVPPLSGDRRVKLAAQVKKLGEEIKVRLRNARRDARKTLEKEHKEGLLTDDQTKKAEHSLDEQTKGHEATVDQLVAAKQAELQQV